MLDNFLIHNGCYCTSKTRKSESNSQRKKWILWLRIRCYCTSKTRKSESNSQLEFFMLVAPLRCYCTSKTRKSESNSQPETGELGLGVVVIALVKLENLKAIHNV